MAGTLFGDARSSTPLTPACCMRPRTATSRSRAVLLEASSPSAQSERPSPGVRLLDGLGAGSRRVLRFHPAGARADHVGRPRRSTYRRSRAAGRAWRPGGRVQMSTAATTRHDGSRQLGVADRAGAGRGGSPAGWAWRVRAGWAWRVRAAGVAGAGRLRHDGCGRAGHRAAAGVARAAVAWRRSALVRCRSARIDAARFRTTRIRGDATPRRDRRRGPPAHRPASRRARRRARRRAAHAERGLDAGLGAPEAALLRAMVLGEDERLSRTFETTPSASGLAHILGVPARTSCC